MGMKDMNKVLLIGRLGRDPEQRETKNGLAVVHFPLATSRRVLESAAALNEGETADGKPSAWRDETEWHRIVVWGKQAEHCKLYLNKGSPVFVEGNIRTRKYTSKDGATRVAFEIHADNVGFLGGRRRPDSNGGDSVSNNVVDESALQAAEAVLATA
jgi:single-strand DNA-binding protein